MIQTNKQFLRTDSGFSWWWISRPQFSGMWYHVHWQIHTKAPIYWITLHHILEDGSLNCGEKSDSCWLLKYLSQLFIFKTHIIYLYCRIYCLTLAMDISQQLIVKVIFGSPVTQTIKLSFHYSKLSPKHCKFCCSSHMLYALQWLTSHDTYPSSFTLSTKNLTYFKRAKPPTMSNSHSGN
jgi:hypothetical protein